jgi:hypothetical protein
MLNSPVFYSFSAYNEMKILIPTLCIDKKDNAEYFIYTE